MSEKNVTSTQCCSQLLHLSQSASDGSNGKDYEFLDNAMAEATHLTDPVRQIKKNIELLKLITETEDEVDSVMQIVDDLEELVCDIDCAADFCKLGGLVQVIRLLKSDCDSVRCEIARLIPLLAQNNLHVQNIILQTDLLPYLLNILEEIASEELLMKALSGLSSIVRGHEKAFSQFVQQKGLEIIENVFQKAINMHHFKLANKVVLITTSIAFSLGSDIKQYNILPILFRMALQLTSDSLGCSYFLDYITNNVLNKESDNNGLKGDEFKMSFMELDNHSKQHLRDFLKRQLNYEEQFSHESYLEHLKKMNMALDEDIKNSELKALKASSNL